MTERPLKALFVTHAFPRHEGDAAGAFVLALARAVSERGVVVDVLAPSAPGLAAAAVIEGIAVRRYRYAAAAWETLAYTGTMAEQVSSTWRGRLTLLLLLRAGRHAVRKALSTGGYDLIHCHWWFPSGLMVPGHAPPMLVTMHGSDVRLARGPLARWFFSRVSARAATMTAVSGWLARAASDALGGRTVGTAPMPAATRLFTPDAAAPRSVDRMLFVGRLNAQKGMGDLLQALSLARRAWSLDVVGDGADREALAQRATALGLAGRVRWHGHLAQPALAPLYRAAAAVVIPSTDEGLGLVGVEASLCETPVIAYASGGLTDVVRDGDTGWLVPTGDIAALSHAIDGVVDRPERARRAGQAARQFALSRYSPEAAGARHRALYDDLVRPGEGTVSRSVMIRRALQLALLGVVAWYVAWNWGDFEHVFVTARPLWRLILSSCVLVLFSRLVLVQTWRQVVQAWGERLSFADGARIWFVSNLGTYVPGRVWAIAAMGTLAQEAGVSPVAAVGSSLVVQLVNLLTGLGVFAAAGAHVMRLPGGTTAGIVSLLALVLLTPWLVPLAVRTLNRVSKRQFAVPHLPPSAIWWAGAGTTVAWVLYGVAFQWFASGISGNPTAGTTGDWIALFIGPYLAGFVAIFSPGGLGVRELAMDKMLKGSGLAVGAVAALLVVASRVWLTILDFVPGVLFLLIRPAARRASSADQ